MNKTNYKSFGIQIALGLLLSSCSALPSDYGPDVVSATQNVFSTNNSGEFLPSLRDMPIEAFTARTAKNWWGNFEDPLLNYLAHETLQKSYDARRAITNVEQAESLLRADRADLSPVIGLNGQINTRDYSEIDLGVGVGGSWDLDLFGETRENIKQAESNVALNKATVRDVRRLVLASMVQTYVAYRTTQARIDLNQHNLGRLLEKQQRIKRLVDSGYSSRLDLDRADTQIFQIQSNIAALEAQKVATRNALAIFVQTSPQVLKGWLERKAGNLSLPSQLLPPSLDYIVRHRPDIRAAEWSLISATHGERAAQLALRPDVTLSGSIFSLGTLGNLTDIGGLSSSILTNIAQPLLGRGRLLAGIDLETARMKQAMINYEEAVFQAALDIDTALATWNRRQQQLAFDQKTMNTAIEAQERAQKLFFAGQESFTAVIVAENTLLAAQDTYLRSRQAAFTSYINYSAATVPGW